MAWSFARSIIARLTVAYSQSTLRRIQLPWRKVTQHCPFALSEGASNIS